MHFLATKLGSQCLIETPKNMDFDLQVHGVTEAIAVQVGATAESQGHGSRIDFSLADAWVLPPHAPASVKTMPNPCT